MMDRKKKYTWASTLWSFGAPLVVAGLITKLDIGTQYCLQIVLGLALMIASALIYPRSNESTTESSDQ